MLKKTGAVRPARSPGRLLTAGTIRYLVIATHPKDGMRIALFMEDSR
jgi:hypothetical protein